MPIVLKFAGVTFLVIGGLALVRGLPPQVVTAIHAIFAGLVLLFCGEVLVRIGGGRQK